MVLWLSFISLSPNKFLVKGARLRKCVAIFLEKLLLLQYHLESLGLFAALDKVDKILAPQISSTISKKLEPSTALTNILVRAMTACHRYDIVHHPIWKWYFCQHHLEIAQTCNLPIELIRGVQRLQHQKECRERYAQLVLADDKSDLGGNCEQLQYPLTLYNVGWRTLWYRSIKLQGSLVERFLHA